MQVKQRFTYTIDGKKVRFTLAAINADDARELLESNTDNRKLRKAKVEEYRRAIERGDFMFNGDAIRISDNHIMLDGQHRLEALAATDKTIMALLVEGLPTEARDTIDVGATRTAANLLEFGGDERVLNAVNVAALGRAALILEDQPMPSKLEVVQFVHQHRDELEKAYHHGARVVEGSPLKGGTTPYALAAWLIAKAEPDHEIIENFFRKLASGEGLYHGDPILALRNRLVSSPPDTAGGSRHRYLRNSALFLRAWNAWATGQELTLIRGWSEGQDLPEAKAATEAVRVRVLEEIDGEDCDEPERVEQLQGA
ncbi:DNA binding protein [Rhodococcus phage Polyyuki]|nr:DNA binding protein [Rhodococcus phage Polyyuki]